MATKTYYAARDFNDAGTERSFKAGDPLTDVEDGSLDNYVAAGLATEDKPKAADAAKSDTTKAADKGA